MKNKFWNDYWNANNFRRAEMIEKLDCFDKMLDVLTSKKLPKKTKKYVFNTMLQSYFDDILEAIQK